MESPGSGGREEIQVKGPPSVLGVTLGNWIFKTRRKMKLNPWLLWLPDFQGESVLSVGD